MFIYIYIYVYIYIYTYIHKKIHQQMSPSSFIKDIPYLALTGELWVVFYEDFPESWPRYNDTALYLLTGSETYYFLCAEDAIWCSMSPQNRNEPNITCTVIMMTSSNGNIFRVTGLLCVEFTGDRWIPHTKDRDAELWCFLWSAPEPTDEQTMETSVIWDVIALIMTSL